MDRTDVAAGRGRLAQRTCCRGAHRGWTWTRCTATGPATRVGEVLRGRRAAPARPVRRSGPRASRRSRATTCPASARAGWPPRQKALIPDPRNDENLIVAQTHLAMINFHNKVVDRTCRAAARQPTVRAGSQAGDAALPVDAATRLPAADLRTHGRRLRVQEGTQARRAGREADRRTDHADRVLRRRVPARPQHDPRRLQLERALRRHRRHSGLDVHLLRPSAATSAASGGCSAAGSRTGAGCTTSRPVASRGLARTDSGVNMAMRIDTRLTNPLCFLPPSTFGGDESAPHAGRATWPSAT